ncbi:DMT family transporter [Haloarcula marina]|uniref:DMT family transporter n=1 Tax=Haloarcula marina TaxID=2961574 RepID=UPI0020B71CF4|nr:EamA family transporter [Halomicroarcula marina]
MRYSLNCLLIRPVNTLTVAIVPLSGFTLSPRYRDAGLFVLLAALFGGSFAAIKTGLRELPPVLFAGLRFDVAAVVLLGYVVLTRGRGSWLPTNRRDLLAISTGAILLVALNNGLLFLGQVSTTPAAASVMYGLNPILAPVFAWWLLGNRLSVLGVAGIGVALCGVVIIVQPSPATLADPSSVGQLLVLGAAGAVALGSVLLRRIEPTLESVVVTAWSMAFGAVILHLGSLVVGEVQPNLFALDTVTLLSIASLGIPSTAVAYAIYFGLIERIGPVRTNLVAYFVPVFAALSGWLVLESAVSPWTGVGFLVVVAGFSLIERQVVVSEVLRLWERLRGNPPVAENVSDD